MKIAHLCTVDLSLRYLLLAQIDAALARGDDVLGISAAGPDVPFLEARGMRHVALASSTRSMDVLADVRAARELWSVLRRERPDVLHTHNPKPGIYGRIVGRLAGVPLIVHTTHGLYATVDDPAPKRLGVYALEALASRCSHVELVQNPEDLDLMARLRIAARPKLRLLGNGVDLDRFRPPLDDGEREAVRSELGFDDIDVVVGFVGRLVAEKGIPELVDAVERLGRPYRLLLVGPHDPAKADALDDAVLHRARQRGAVLTGHRTDVDRVYRAMDVFCLPSHREGFPRAAMEAAASGLPVVATDIRGCRQVVEPGRTGRLVPVGDPEALATAIAEVVADDPRAVRAAARSRAGAEFDERGVVERVLAAYDEHPTPHRGRIFGIGLNKTGTRSVAMALRMLGYRTMHKGDAATSALVDRAASEGVPLLTHVGERFDAYFDIQGLVRRFAELDEQYPGSKFLLTTRRLDGWLASRSTHVGAGGGTVELEAWRAEREAHHAAVRAHFAGRPGALLELDVTAGHGWEQLAPFLGLPVPDRPFPWENQGGIGTYRPETRVAALRRRAAYARARAARRLRRR